MTSSTGTQCPVACQETSVKESNIPKNDSSNASKPSELDKLRHNSASSLLQLTNAAGLDGESEPTLVTQEREPFCLHTSKSTPGFSEQIVARISSSLLHQSTVVHRPIHTARPTTLPQEPSLCTSRLVDNILDRSSLDDVTSLPSQPSSLIGSRITPTSLQSTAPTSMMSSGATRSAETTRRVGPGLTQSFFGNPSTYEAPVDYINHQCLIFPRQDAPRVSEPSVATVENAAAAKIYLESHFNFLLGTKTRPRSLRRRNMERKLFAMALSNEERHSKRQE
ncbi:hypothetical protein BS50DRAFT_504625, partial [Corynespora cassiicola Philippines]